ncbi:MAG: hypothetical protein LLG08_08670 [Actinomycetia bacterium]|nr:hypothetical protein [Actinomycetes bacterium]
MFGFDSRGRRESQGTPAGPRAVTYGYDDSDRLVAYGIGPGGMFGYATGVALTAAWVDVVLARRARLGLWWVIFALVARIGVIVLAQIGSAFLYEWVVR